MKTLQKKIIGIDLHDYSAEVVELTARGKGYQLDAFNMLTVPEKLISNGDFTDEEAMSGFLRYAMTSANPRAVGAKNVSLSFPASKVLTHIFEMAGSLSEREIRKALPYEAETIIPYAFDDIYWDFTVLRKEGKDKKHGNQYVLFACIQKDIAEKYSKLFESSGLNPVMFGINAEVVKSAISRHLMKDKIYLALDIGTLSVDSMILKNGVLMDYVNSNESGSKLISELADDLAPKNAGEIFEGKEFEKFHNDRSLERVGKFLERCYNRGQQAILDFESASPFSKVEGVVLTGHFLHLPHFYSLAKKYFAGRELIIGNPRTNIAVDDAKFKLWKETINDSAVQRPYAIYFTNAIGAALKGLKLEGINLLPSRLKDGLAKKKRLFFVAAASILMSVVAVSLAIFFVMKFNAMDYEKKTLSIGKKAVQQVIFGTRYKEMYDHITVFNGEVNILYEIDRTLFPLKTVIDDLFARIPEGVSLTSWKWSDRNLSFEIDGIAEEREALLKMRKNMEESDFVSEVVAPISNYDKKTDLSFQLTLKLDVSSLPYYAANAQ